MDDERLVVMATYGPCRVCGEPRRHHKFAETNEDGYTHIWSRILCTSNPTHGHGAPCLETEQSMDGRVYTREDELDIIDEDLGVLRRRLWNLESAPYEGRACDQDAIDYSAARIREQIRQLERERYGMLCDKVAEAEGFAS